MARKPNQRSPWTIGSDGRPRLLSPEAIYEKPTPFTELDKRNIRIITEEMVCGPVSEGRTRLESWAKRMQAAALEDAVRVLRSGGSMALANRLDFAYDVWWVRGARPSSPGFSLRDICAGLGLEYWEVRERLEALADAAPKEGYKRKRGSKCKIKVVEAA